MTEKVRIPQIRFKGFTDPWEQCKLGDIGSTFTGLSGKTSSDFGHGDASFITYMNVFTNPIADPNRVEPIEIDNCQRQVQYGDVFFTTSSETPDEVGMSSIWLENKANVYLNSFCFGYRLNINIDPYYFAYLLRSDVIRKPMRLLAQGISRFNISKNKVMEISASLPNLVEQRKIGTIMYKLDNLITLHQCKDFYGFNKYVRKNTPLKSHKITTTWEQCKLNKIADIIGGGTPSTQTSEFWDGDIDWYAPAEMEGKIYANGSERKITKLGLQKSSAKLLPAYKTILFTSRAGIGKMAILQRVGATNQGFQSLVLKDEYNPYFIYSMGSKIKTKAETIASGSTFLEISGRMLGNIEISCPKENEQIKIGKYFNKLDNLITLHLRL